MSEELQALIAKLTEEWSKNPDAVIEALPTGPKTLRQKLFDEGHSVATEELTRKVGRLEREKTDLDSELATAREQIETLEQKAPDVAQVREEYQTRIDELKTKHATELEERDQRLLSGDKERALDEFASKLHGKGVDRDYAWEVMRGKHADRINVEKQEDGNVRTYVVEKGKTIPLQTSGEQTPIDVLVEEVLPGVDPKWKTEDVDTTGSRARKGTTGTPASKSRADDIRAKVDQKYGGDSDPFREKREKLVPS